MENKQLRPEFPTRSLINNSRGASILEVLICLLLMASLTGYAGLRLNQFQERLQLKATSSQIRQLLTMAQRIAVKTGENCQIAFESNNLKTHCALRLPVQQMQHRVRLYPRFGGFSSARTFSAYPNASVSPGRIEIHSKNQRCMLIVSLRGAIREHC